MGFVLHTLPACALQDLREETVSFMWAMFELNPHTFDALDTISIDSPSVPQAPSSDERDWPAILVLPNTPSTHPQYVDCVSNGRRLFGGGRP